MQRHRRQLTWFALWTLLALLIAGAAYGAGAAASLNERITDRFFAAAPAHPDLIIIEIDEASLASIGRWPWPRDVHAQLLAKLPEAKLVAFDILFTEPATDAAEDEQLAAAIAEHGRVVLAAAYDEQSGLILEPIPLLSVAATVGIANTTPDRDGVVRFMVGEVAGVGSLASKIAGTDFQTTLPERVWYRGPAATVPTLSYIDVLEGRIPSNVFTDKRVLIGTTAAGLGDTYQTPVGAMAGVEINANVAASYLDEMRYQEASATLVAALLLGLALVLLAVFVFVAHLLWLGLLTGFIFTGTLLGTAFSFSNFLVIPPLYLLLFILLESGGLLAVRYFSEQREKAFIRKSFAQYLAPEVVRELEEHPERLTLGGEARTLTILFSDIRGFTTLSEQLTPTELMTQLNEYLGAMSDAVMDHRGLVDKYIGDAVMAFWNAPLTNAEHAADACRSVITMFTALEKLNQGWKEQGRPEFAIGVGVSTGEVVVGNMGSQKRFNYSVIGDEVNFSARIEGLTKQYGVQCLLGESTFALIKDRPEFTVRELDDVLVKGKDTPRRIYELVVGEVSAEKRAALVAFANGRAAYLAGDFAAAFELFTTALEADPSDTPSQVFLERTRELIATPPEQWDGVYKFTSK